MSDVISENDPSEVEENGDLDINRIAMVKDWLVSQFGDVGRDVPDFENTSESISYLYNLATLSQANTQAALLVANDHRQKAAEYFSEAGRIREILENVGLAEDDLPQNVVLLAQIIANVANMLNIRDTELSSFLLASAGLVLRKEKWIQVKRESKALLDLTRKAITRLIYLKKTLQQLEDGLSPCKAQMEKWERNLELMDAKQRQYMQQLANFKKLLNRVGYTPEIRHGALVEMAEEKEELEEETAPIFETLRSYKDLPPDKGLAILAIGDKEKEYAAAEQYLEDLLQSLTTTE